MKALLSPLAFLLLAVFGMGFIQQQASITGAWHLQEEDDETVLICVDGYIVITEFNQVNTAFSYSIGSRYQLTKNSLLSDVEFTTSKTELQEVGAKGQLEYSLSGEKLTVTKKDNTKKVFSRLDDGNGAVAGVWQKPGEKAEQKTLLIITGKRFQYVTYNTKTKELITSHGGRYTYSDEKIKEDIEFYRKNPDMIGKTLAVDVEINKDRMKIKGEEWRRIKNLE